MHVTIEQAEKAIEAARKRALELNTQMCIAVVDSSPISRAFTEWMTPGSVASTSR